MTTHPPGHPTGPTGPGREDLEQHHLGIGEPHEHSMRPRPWCGAAAELGGQQPCPVKVACGPGECRIGQATGSETYRSASLPTLADVVADTDRYLVQAEHVIARQCRPAAAGGGDPEMAHYFRQAVALHIAAARRDLERLTNAHVPPEAKVRITYVPTISLSPADMARAVAEELRRAGIRRRPQ